MNERHPPNRVCSDAEPVLILKPPRRPVLAGCAALSGACIAVGFFMALLPMGRLLLWLAVGFAGVAGLGCVGCLLPGNSALILTADGLTIQTASRTTFYPWSEVDFFAVADRRSVCFRLVDTSERVSPLARQLTGFDGVLPAHYGEISSELLAQRLNECRELGRGQEEVKSEEVKSEE